MRLNPDQFWSFYEWLGPQGGLLHGTVLVVTMAIIGFIISYVIAMIRIGPTEAFYAVSKIISDLLRIDIPKTSFRRLWAIAILAFMEAIRRKVLVVIAIFIVAIMFAGWFLDRRSEHPAQLYISFVLTATNYLVILLGIFLATFSLPADIKNRTIYTITTKPVRPTEIILGRVVGFSLIGSIILTVLGVFSYLFVVRGLNHHHEVASISQDGKSGETDYTAFHKHTFKLNADGEGITEEEKGHRHTIKMVEEDGKKKYIVGAPYGDLSAKIPIYGNLQYTDRQGNLNTGLNVGYMSEYRKFIAGGSLSSAIWRFKDIRPDDFKNGLKIEMNLEAFRTFKGDIVTPVRGSMILRSPDSSVESERRLFFVKESIEELTLPHKIQGFKLGQPATLDLFTDVVVDGQLEIIIRCEDSDQYIGMAAADLALRPTERPFWWNFLKGYISIWLQMVIVISFGVMFSTFLSGPVAMVATFASLGLGFFGANIDYFFTAEHSGGGPVESIIRIVTRKGVMLDMDLGNPLLEKTIRNVDYVVMYGVSTLKSAVPDFGKLGTSDFIAYGVDLFDGLLARHIFITLGYFLMTSIIGYFFVKTREMAA